MGEEIITLENDRITSALFGRLDENVKLIEERMKTKITLREGNLVIYGEDDQVEGTKSLLMDLLEVLKIQKRLDKSDVRYCLDLKEQGENVNLSELLDQVVVYTSMGRAIRPKTLGQKRYLDSILENDIVFGIGPAGTGKTYLAMANAVNAFKNKEVGRIILTRPAVEAGESLGFLPGDLQMKVDPYLRPLYDALFEILGYDTYQKYVERGMIEVAPLAYMRGRTLDGAYVILDEAQNTTNEQMKMFLTRLGYGSKAIITGDITQIDLPKGKQSGLKSVLKILKDVRGIGMVYLTRNDIVRHPLVQRIIDAYDIYEKRQEQERKEKDK